MIQDGCVQLVFIVKLMQHCSQSNVRTELSHLQGLRISLTVHNAKLVIIVWMEVLKRSIALKGPTVRKELESLYHALKVPMALERTPSVIKIARLARLERSAIKQA